MKSFSIAEVEQYSLIKAHTIRAWEKRFGFLKATRTATNFRIYTLDELAYLLNFSLLNRYGHRVSNIASLDQISLKKGVCELEKETAKQERLINELIISMFSMNIEDFEMTLDMSVRTWGIDQTIRSIILPFLERMELFSYKGRTTSEYHFVVTAVRKKLHLGIEQASPRKPIAKSALLFLPEGEHYDLLLLYLNYQLRESGLNVLYLGTNISVGNVLEVIQRKKPHFVVMYVSPKGVDNLHQLAQDLFKKEENISYLVTAAKPFAGNQCFCKNIRLVDYRNVAAEVLSMV